MLRVDLENGEGNTAYSEYNLFGDMSENDKYKLIHGSYSGSSGHSLAVHHGMPFTSRDQNSGNQGGHNCAIKFKGSWWYKRCDRSNLNGLYLRGNHSSFADGMNWFHWKGHHYSLTRIAMKIIPVDF